MIQLTKEDQARVDALHPRVASMLEVKMADGLPLDTAIEVAERQHAHDIKAGVYVEPPVAVPVNTVEPVAPVVVTPAPTQTKFQANIAAPSAVAPGVKDQPKPATAQTQARRP